MDVSVPLDACDYRRLFDHSPLPSWIYDLGTRRILAANEAAALQYGFTREELERLTLDDVRPPEDVPAHAASIAAAVNAPGDMGIWRHKRRDGSVFPVHVYSAQVSWEGRAARVAILCPHETADAAGPPRLPSVALTLFDSISEAFLTLDREWRITFLNRAAAAVFQRERSALLGCVLWDIFPEARSLRFFTELSRAVESGEAVTFEEYYAPLDLWIEARAYPSDLGVSVYFRDVTERKRSEEALQESERRFRTLADSGPVLVWMSDATGQCVFVSRAWLEMTGRRMSEALGAGWCDAVHPGDLARVRPLLTAAVATHSRFEFEYRLRTRDGSYRWVLDAGRPRFAPDGTFLGYVGSCADIQSVREAEEVRERLRREQSEADRRQRAFLRDVLFSVTEGRLRLCAGRSELPEPLPAFGEPIPLTQQELASVRRRVREAAGERGFPDVRLYDIMSAASECAMNALQHGGGAAVARVCAGPERLQVWVEDRGKGIDVAQLPKATLLKGHSGAGGFGHGFFLILQACDRVHLLTGPEGTTIVLEQAREEPPERNWPLF